MVSEQVWKQEEDYLALVSRRIREELERLEATVSHRNESAIDIRKHFWDEISVRTSMISLCLLWSERFRVRI